MTVPPFLYSEEYAYDDSDHLKKTIFSDKTSKKTQEYTYRTADRINSEKLDNGMTITYGYDKLQRVTSKSVGTNNQINTAYTFAVSARGSGYTTSKIARETIGGIQYDYTYDGGGNLTTVKEYDPEVGRWINADGYVSTGVGLLGVNMYAYCNNSSVNMIDLTGGVPDHILLANAEKYANGANILMCGYDNNRKKATNEISSSAGTANVAASIGADIALYTVRNAYETAERPNNIGKGTYRKNIDLMLKEIDQLSEYVDDIFSAIDYICIGMEVGENAYNNLQANKGTAKILWDSTVDGGILILNSYGSGLVGTAAASVVAPQYALAVGISATVGAEYILSNIGNEVRKEMKKWIK